MPRRVAEMRRSFFVQGSHSIPLLPKNHKLPYAYARVRTGTRERAHASPQTRASKYQNSHLSHQNFHQNKFSLTNNAGKKTIARFKKTSDVFHIFLYFAIYAITPCEPDTRTKYENKTHKQQRTRQKTTYRRRKNYSRERLFFSIVSTHSSRRYKSSGEK